MRDEPLSRLRPISASMALTCFTCTPTALPPPPLLAFPGTTCRRWMTGRVRSALHLTDLIRVGVICLRHVIPFFSNAEGKQSDHSWLGRHASEHSCAANTRLPLQAVASRGDLDASSWQLSKAVPSPKCWTQVAGQSMTPCSSRTCYRGPEPRGLNTGRVLQSTDLSDVLAALARPTGLLFELEEKKVECVLPSRSAAFEKKCSVWFQRSGNGENPEARVYIVVVHVVVLRGYTLQLSAADLF